MPKKFQGENSKAAEARARKGKVAEDERLLKEKMAEDKLWEDNDKHILKKLERQEEKEKKQQEAMQKKLERDKLLEEEMNSIKGAKNAAPAKVTRAHIDATLERERLAKIAAAVRTKEENAGTKPPLELDEDAPLHENVNRLVAEEGAARNVDEALAALSTKDEDSGDKHPEKRVRGAYIAFEERELPRLKEEYPNFRLSQLKQMLKKEWQKSAENPFNQSTQAYNSARR